MKCKLLLTGSNGVLSKSKSRRCVTCFCKSAKLFLSVKDFIKRTLVPIVRQAKKGLFPCSTHCLGRFVVISFRKQPFIMLVSLSVLLIYVLASSATYNFAWKIWDHPLCLTKWKGCLLLSVDIVLQGEPR